jgi:predicted Zn-dependent protease
MVAIKKIFILFLYFAFSISAAFSFSIPSAYSTDSLDERRLGNKVLQSIWDSKSVIKDMESQIYIKELGQDLVNKSNQPKRHYDFFLLEDDSVNAFASWNGYVGVHDALVLFSDNESELAAILAHEISHITQEHLKRYQDKSAKQKILTVGGIIASVLVKNSELTEAIATTTIANDLQNQINYTREHEWEADNFSVNILEKTDFNIDGLGSFFKRMEGDNSTNDYLRTHPLNIDRVANSQSRAEKFKRSHKSSFDYETMKIRLQASDNRGINLEDPKTNLYSKAYKYFLSKELTKAVEYIEELLKINQDYSSLILAGRVYGELKQEAQAEKFFESARKHRDNEVVRYLQAEMYITNNEPSKAIKLLKNFTRLNKTSVFSETLLADAYLKISAQDRYQFHRGNAEVLKGNHEEAIKHFNLAKNLTQNKDFFDLVNSRAKFVDEEKRILEIKD